MAASAFSLGRPTTGCRLWAVSASDGGNDSVEEQPLRVMIAAGGTGGHVYPAIAIADALKASREPASVLFVGTHHRIEASAVPRAGYELRHIPAAPLRRPIFLSVQNLLLPFRLLHSIFAALQLVAAFRPHVVVGTGGYVAVPVCLAAFLCGRPFVIQEQNACPGIANRILASFARSVFVAFAAALPHFPAQKCHVSGNPIRWTTLQQLVPKAAAVRHFFSDSSLPFAPEGSSKQPEWRCHVILVLGGSLGSNSLNQAVMGFAEDMLNRHPDRFLIWQTGSKHFKGVLDRLGHHKRLLICEFLFDMNLAYSAADLVVACSGASTCSELLALGKPSILIPLRYVADNHQRGNATVLEIAGASRVLDDLDLTSEKLERAINELLGDKGMLSSMSKNALRIAAPHAADFIAKEIVSLAQSMP